MQPPPSSYTPLGQRASLTEKIGTLVQPAQAFFALKRCLQGWITAGNLGMSRFSRNWDYRKDMVLENIVRK